MMHLTIYGQASVSLEISCLFSLHYFSIFSIICLIIAYYYDILCIYNLSRPLFCALGPYRPIRCCKFHWKVVQLDNCALNYISIDKWNYENPFNSLQSAEIYTYYLCTLLQLRVWRGAPSQQRYPGEIPDCSA